MQRHVCVAGAARSEAADGVLVVQVLQRVERGGLRAGGQQPTQTHPTGHLLNEQSLVIDFMRVTK